MRQTLGIAVFSGMLGVTAFGIFFTPVFYAVIRRFSEPKAGPSASMRSDKDITTVPVDAESKMDTDGHIAKPDSSAQAVH
jgi:hypothetical protein